ncbi:hypothetical protein L1987_57688 [Smallanthus sonchifolius]|uniref:Uncharacterized protein n=1 Tax=Smallanthus sonchifolius TaxID=185202 RepID=A0ACB9DDH3_9ASTR|nr:hypothetical protein L1987_57688 [Smallanthus sonchifolius]
MSSNVRKHSCDEVDVHMSWKKPKLSKSQKLVSKVNMDGVDHDDARLNTNGKKRAMEVKILAGEVDMQWRWAIKLREWSWRWDREDDGGGGGGLADTIVNEE